MPDISNMFAVQELQVDGDLLLNITDQELCHDLGMTAGLSRKRQVPQTLQHESCNSGLTAALSHPAGF